MKTSDISGNLRIDLVGTGFNKYIAKQHSELVASHLKVSHGLIYVLGQHLISIEDSDFFYPFRQRRAFYYLSGVDEPDCHLTYDIRKNTSTLYIPRIPARKAVWYGRGRTIDEAREKYDFDDVRWSSTLESDLQLWIYRHPNSKIFVLDSAQAPKILANSLQCDKKSLKPAIAASRVIKDNDEIATIRQAIAISSAAHVTIMHYISSLRSEAEVQGLFQDVCISSDAPLQAYEPIVASGKNASILHYTANNQYFYKDSQLLCLDSGCEFKCYASDITRTFPLAFDGRWPTKEAESLYRLVATMQEACIAKLQPGVHFFDLFRLAQRIAVSGLIRLGVLRLQENLEEIDDFINTGGIYAFFPHGLGHHVGLDVHDVGPIDQQPIRIAEPTIKKPWTQTIDLKSPCKPDSVRLAPGMVVTVEPGLYFNEYTLNELYLCHDEFKALVDVEVLAEYIKVGGVRIEDDVLITQEGYENLTTTPKGDSMLEIIREGAKCDHGSGCPHQLERVAR